MLVWDHGSPFQPCKCPLCRRQISLLVPSEVSPIQQGDPEVARVLNNIRTYNRHFGGNSTGFSQQLQDLPFLLRRLLRELLNPQRSLPLVIRTRVYIAMVLSVVYAVSPIDIIPEALLGLFGLMDDIFILLICFLYIAAIYRSVLYNRHGET